MAGCDPLAFQLDESRRRGVDFYDEGALIWLDADTLIREKTNGAKSLDDFAKAFYGGESGPPQVKPYSFEDVVKALNSLGATPQDLLAILQAMKTAGALNAEIEVI